MSRTDKDRPYHIQANDPVLKRSGQSRVTHEHGTGPYWRYRGVDAECDAEVYDPKVHAKISWRTRDKRCWYWLIWMHRIDERYRKDCRRIAWRQNRASVRTQLRNLLRSGEWEDADIIDRNYLDWWDWD